MLVAVMLTATIQNFVKLGMVMLSEVMLNEVMLRLCMLNAIFLIVNIHTYCNDISRYHYCNNADCHYTVCHA
jgi:hypothetical protein